MFTQKGAYYESFVATSQAAQLSSFHSSSAAAVAARCLPLLRCRPCILNGCSRLDAQRRIQVHVPRYLVEILGEGASPTSRLCLVSSLSTDADKDKLHLAANCHSPSSTLSSHHSVHLRPHPHLFSSYCIPILFSLYQFHMYFLNQHHYSSRKLHGFRPSPGL